MSSDSDSDDRLQIRGMEKRSLSDDDDDDTDTSSDEEQNQNFKRQKLDSKSDDSESEEEMGRPSFGGAGLGSMGMAPEKGQTGTGYTDAAQKMMEKMGYKKGKGLGKHGQGRVEIVEASKQRGRRGLGMVIQGLEAKDDADWDFETEKVVIDEEVDWLPHCSLPVPSIENLKDWKKIGTKKRTINDENTFCDEETLAQVLGSKSVFDSLEPEEMRRARTRSNPYETLRGGIFQNRAAMKMANMDAILDFMFTQPRNVDGKPLLGPTELMHFADICAGPGGFSEYVLWRLKGEAKGFGFTLKGPCDFKLEEFFAGPAEMFEPHYGVGGTEGNGDIFNVDNQQEFIKFVKENTNGEGVHFVMADGGFSVEGQENIQEILSKQLYLCQFLVAISILKTGGHFVCKLFDLFTQFSVGLVYLMYRIFDRVSIYKPVTSRPANSERYIVCRNMRGDGDAVRQYFHDINVDLNKYLVSTSTEDVNEVVPLFIMEEDTKFFEYIVKSNINVGINQIQGLRKIQIFTQNTQLYESRQADVRTQCLQKWKVPDEVRTKPGKQDPNTVFNEITQDEDTDYFESLVTNLTPDNLHKLHTPYDYRCYVLGGHDKKRWYILGLGRAHVFKWDGNPRLKWKKLEENVRISLPNRTLIEVEFVQELKGEGMGQKRQMTLHVLDALFLYGKDVRSLHFNDRIEKLKKFVKSITKTTRSDLTPVVVPSIFRMEHIKSIFERLSLRRVKGSSQPRLCYSPPDRTDGRMFLPTGVCIVKTVKDPWTVALSVTRGMKYFYNLSTRESKFDIPKESIATARDSKLHSYCWVWEEGVKIHDCQSFNVDKNKVSKDDIVNYIQELLDKLHRR